ncbi:MAG: hypothetical protein WA751_08705 [Candidatus Dormiibacterota bacterium]
MTNGDLELEERLRRYLRHRMEAAARVNSQPLLPTRAGVRRRSRRAALVAGLGVAVIAAALVFALAFRHQAPGSDRSYVVGPGKVRIEAVSTSQGRLTSDQVPDWVESAAASLKWQVQSPSGTPSGQVTGLEITAGYYIANATSVKIYNEGRYSSPGQPQDLWIVVIEAPPQSGYSSITGNAVINASTRQVVETDFFATIAPKTGAASPAS